MQFIFTFQNEMMKFIPKPRILWHNAFDGAEEKKEIDTFAQNEMQDECDCFGD